LSLATTPDPALPSVTSASVQTLSWSPRAFLWRAALTPSDADALVAAAAPRLAPSTLALRPGEKAEDKVGIRTSDGAFMSAADDPSGVLAKARAVAAALTGLPPSHGEAFNILRYRPGARYEAHYDAFSPNDGYGPQASTRLATVLFYLSDVEEGGETVFPLAGEAGAARLAAQAPIDYKSCEEGLKVRPTKGDALLFWSAHPNGSADLQALHGGCPVLRGEKWVATLWLRDQAEDAAGNDAGGG
jgi:prolyl 4-hydroxylase